MAVYKEEKTETWRAVYRYTDWNGERKQTQKLSIYEDVCEIKCLICGQDIGGKSGILFTT